MDTENSFLFEIIVGTYEKFLLGYRMTMKSDSFILKQSFATEAHVQSIKCIASSKKYLASGSNDETIQLFNMNSRKELGSLIHHNGTITGLEFYNNYLLSCSEDHTICIWSTSKWECLKTLSGHKKNVHDIAIHPSGKMVLSVSDDKRLRTWNLITGRSAFATRIDKVAEHVYWSPDGSHFVITCNSTVDVYDLEQAAVISTINFGKKVCDVCFIGEKLLAVGGENENIVVYDLKSGNKHKEIKAHGKRIKVLKSVCVSEETFLISAASDGYIRVWHIDLSEGDMKAYKISKVNTGSRPTCMTITSNQ